MERKIASQIVEATVSLNEAIGALDIAIAGIPDRQEKRRYVVALGDILRVITVDILHEIIKDYPDLDPYANRVESVGETRPIRSARK